MGEGVVQFGNLSEKPCVSLPKGSINIKNITLQGTNSWPLKKRLSPESNHPFSGAI